MRALTTPVAVALTAGLAVLLSACSGAEAEEPTASEPQVSEAEQAWRDDLVETTGTDTFDFEALRAQAAQDCGRTQETDWVVRLGLSGSLETSEVTRIGVEHACPEVLGTFDSALAKVEGAADPMALVCAVPATELTAEDQLKVDLVCSAG